VNGFSGNEGSDGEIGGDDSFPVHNPLDSVGKLVRRGVLERKTLIASTSSDTIEGVARKLHLSEETLRHYLSSAIKKFGVKNRVEAAKTAEREG